MLNMVSEPDCRLIRQSRVRPLTRYEALVVHGKKENGLPHHPVGWFAMTVVLFGADETGVNQGGTASICKIAALGAIQGRFSF